MPPYTLKQLRKPGALLLACVFAGWLRAGEPPAPPATLEDLQERITRLITHPRYDAAWWGVKIASLDTGKIIFEANAGKLFSPASNTKLYTAALALDRLGPDYRIRTSLYARERPDPSGTLKGDLIVYGRGDPTMNLKPRGGEIFRSLEPLAAALTNAGVKSIRGDLIADESYFQGPPFGSGWNWDDLQSAYGAEISALTINDNVALLRVQPGERAGDPCRVSFDPPPDFLASSNRARTLPEGSNRNISWYRPWGQNTVRVDGSLPVGKAEFTDSVPVHDPAAWFAGLFREALARHGIPVSGRSRSVSWLDRRADPVELARWVEIGAVESPPLRDILRETLKKSQNLYTDLLLAHVGAVLHGAQPLAPDETTEAAGISALRTFLAEAGVPPRETFFDEGSGLSRNNLTTPNATLRLLVFMSRHKNFEIYRQCLPVAGVDGTLRSRMIGTPAAGNVRAKTGTLEWVGSLSGYVTTAAGEHVAFCLMLNRFHNAEADRSRTADLDAIATLLASFTGRTS
jgi:D-alanyl-D-alanine carboxypeptidase/D-alanyl-D-alanine-endopeptidase (penicillin-binding protein 4)